MAECPYCSGPVSEGDRYCPRCGERQTDREDRDGFFDPPIVQYLDGVRNGARTFDEDSTYHDRFERELGAAVGDFAHLAGVDLDLRETLDIDVEPASGAAIDPADADATKRQLLGLAVLLGLVSDAFPETGVDELLTTYYDLRDEH
ncbi:MAG: zinc ribbon domain-containing protein [Halapricum sp.]